jgi:hypothetical protein
MSADHLVHLRSGTGQAAREAFYDASSAQLRRK